MTKVHHRRGHQIDVELDRSSGRIPVLLASSASGNYTLIVQPTDLEISETEDARENFVSVLADARRAARRLTQMGIEYEG